MSHVMQEVRYSKDHIWVRLDDDERVTIGVSDFAAQEGGEILSVSLPEDGMELVKDDVFGTMHAAASKMDLYIPISGEVSEINYELEENPEIINEDPLHDGWLIRMVVPSLSDFDELLTEEEYEEHLSREIEANEEDVEGADDLAEDLEDEIEEDMDDESDDEMDPIDDDDDDTERY